MALPIALITSATTLIGKAMDLFGDDDKAQAQALLKQLEFEQQNVQSQLEINKTEAAHDSLFVAGARPFLLWTCGLALFSNYIVRPYFMAFYPEINIPSIDNALFELMLGMLGLGGLRSIEKIKGVSK